MEKNEAFNYTYSAEQRQEIEEIRKKYLPPEQDKMTRLRRLHASASSKAMAFSIAIGVIGALLLGSGMSLIMTDLASKLGFGGGFAMVLGVLLGLVGLVLMALAYPVYDKILKKERARIAPEILRLTDELLN